jgi:hypothetical protein
VTESQTLSSSPSPSNPPPLQTDPQPDHKASFNIENGFGFCVTNQDGTILSSLNLKDCKDHFTSFNSNWSTNHLMQKHKVTIKDWKDFNNLISLVQLPKQENKLNRLVEEIVNIVVNKIKNSTISNLKPDNSFSMHYITDPTMSTAEEKEINKRLEIYGLSINKHYEMIQFTPRG